jgi:E-phenylitaconyl-CoA hydratase
MPDPGTSDWLTIDLSGPLEGVRYDKRDDGIAVITLDRPERGNALFPGLGPIMRAIWHDIGSDDRIRAAVVTGAGDRHFCTGADMRMSHESSGVARNRPMEEQVFWTARHNKVWKPMIAAVNGTVAGGGLHYVVDADVVVSAEHAQFLDTHVSVGFVGGLENVGLAKRLPLGTALRMSLQGRDFRLSAERAYTLGLVDELVPRGQALEVALELARSISRNSPQAVTLTQQAIWASLEMPYEQALRYAWSLIRLQWNHPDFAEGPRAFVEKRDPVWNPDPDAKLPPA